MTTKLDDILEVIKQGVFEMSQNRNDKGIAINEEERETNDNIHRFLDLAVNSYTVVSWPDSQEYMEKEWFEEEAVLDVEGKFGDSAYFIPTKRLFEE